MEPEINLKNEKFQEKYQISLTKLFLCKRIVSFWHIFCFSVSVTFQLCSNLIFVSFFIFQIKILTEAVFDNEVRAQTKIKTNADLKGFYEAVSLNLDIVTDLFELFNTKADQCLSNLVSIENDLSYFTYNSCDFKEYKIGTICECMVMKIENCTKGYCFLNDLTK